MRVALAHDWLTGMRGGERVLEAMVDLYPDAEIHTLLHVPGSVSPKIEARPIHTSFLQRVPGARTRYRWLLPLFPAAAERLRPGPVDLLISSSHCVAKGVRAPAGTPHLCYCHTPMRYVWDLYDEYFGPGRAGPLVRAVAPALAARLRRWDVESAGRVDAFLANSEHIAERIRRCWGRDAEVVHPPVDVDRFRPAPAREDFYLVVSALVPYKGVDLAIGAARRLGRRLVVVGDGPEAGRLRRLAGAGVVFKGRVGDREVADLMGRCRALVHPAVEDFGITAVEAQAAGAPVIALAAGGALETVIGEGPGATGVFFSEPSAAALAEAMESAESHTFDPAALRSSAERFAPSRFRAGLRAAVERVVGPGTPSE